MPVMMFYCLRFVAIIADQNVHTKHSLGVPLELGLFLGIIIICTVVSDLGSSQAIINVSC